MGIVYILVCPYAIYCNCHCQSSNLILGLAYCTVVKDVNKRLEPFQALLAQLVWTAWEAWCNKRGLIASFSN